VMLICPAWHLNGRHGSITLVLNGSSSSATEIPTYSYTSRLDAQNTDLLHTSHEHHCLADISKSLLFFICLVLKSIRNITITPTSVSLPNSLPFLIKPDQVKAQREACADPDVGPPDRRQNKTELEQ
jgi:hypothetical protein